MKNQLLLSFLCGFLIAPASCLSQEVGDHRKWTYTQEKSLTGIVISAENGETRNCELDGEVSRAILSFDRATLIVSENGYVKTAELRNCDKHKKVAIKIIPEENGMLVDFNSLTNTYISLIFVAVQPLSYVAYIGKLGLNKNLINLPGAFSTNKKLGKMQQEAFVYSDGFAYRPKILPNGKYVTPDGDVDCSPQSYPGVWNIHKNKKVTISQTAALAVECNALFDK